MTGRENVVEARSNAGCGYGTASLCAMPQHLIPTSPALRVELLHPGGQAGVALLLGVRWDEETGETRALIITEHGGIDWVSDDRIEAARID